MPKTLLVPSSEGYANSVDVSDERSSYARRQSSIFPSYLRRKSINRRPSVFEAESTTTLNPFVTQEPIPCVENYRNLESLERQVRPSLDELHEPQTRRSQSKNSIHAVNESFGIQGYKLGWINGVYIRTILNIWGVMLFLRMGWLTGQAGIVILLLQILLSTLVTVVTTLSMSAICTNGQIGTGGAYYMISRSLGPEAGAAIGLITFFANAIMTSLNVVGTAEAIGDILNLNGIGIVELPSGLNDARITGVVCLIFVALIPLVGMAWEAKAQIFLLVVLLISLGDYFIGAFMSPSEAQIGQGYVGWKLSTVEANLWPKWDGANFFSVFGVFFPSVTGILTGASMSGDLRDPSDAIPKGTLAAIGTTSSVYAIITVFLGCTFLPYATGNRNITLPLNSTCSPDDCPFGLINDYQTMSLSAFYPPLIYAGIFASTVSSALASYVTAPRIFQALCADNLFPYIGWFGKGYGPTNDPRRGYLLTFVIAFVFILIGDLNSIAPIISNFFMGSFFLVNITCFHASYIKSPNFRPSFKYFNKWISLFAAIVCLVIMFLLDYITALITTLILIAVFIYINNKNLDIQWGCTTEGQTFNVVLSSALKLNQIPVHVKNYRPCILLLTGNPSARPSLIDFAGSITNSQSLLIMGHITAGPIPFKVRAQAIERQINWMRKQKVKAFYVLVEASSLWEGVKNVAQLSGLGRLRANIVMMGFKNDWSYCVSNDMLDYFNIIHSVLDMHFSLIILRLAEGLDFTEFFGPTFKVAVNEESIKNNNNMIHNLSDQSLCTINSSTLGPSHNKDTVEHPVAIKEEAEAQAHVAPVARVPKTSANLEVANTFSPNISHGNSVSSEVASLVNKFRVQQRKGTIDVWWIYDDGGLTLLIPYILSIGDTWGECKLRIFTVTKDSNIIDSVQKNLTQLLTKFRIPVTAVTVLSLSDLGLEPQEESKQSFREMISKWMVEHEDGGKKLPYSISKEDLLAHKEKTNRTLRLRELLIKHSADATLIVMTLPLPRKGSCPAPLYLAWIDILTNDMPPFLLIRGNQTSVLTFYS